MKAHLPVLVGVAALGIATTVVAGTPANAGPGLAQTATATLALPGAQATKLLTRCVNGSCTTVSSPEVAAQTMAIQLVYSLVNASSLPDVISYTGKLVTVDDCNGRTGVALTISGTNIGTSHGKASVNGTPVGDDAPLSHSENGHSESLCLPF